MSKVLTDHKKVLLSMGKWGDFVLRRDELKASGVNSAEANRVAVREFLGEEASKCAGETRRRIPKPAVVKAVRVLSTIDTIGKVGRSFGVLDPVVASLPEPDVEGREAGGQEIVMWVLRELGKDSEPDKRTCPDPAAWSLYKQCQDSALFKQNFMLQLGVKSLLRIEGAQDTGEVDGVKQIDTIDQLLLFAVPVKGSA